MNIKGKVVAKKCDCCGHHEVGIEDDLGGYTMLKPGMEITVHGDLDGCKCAHIDGKTIEGLQRCAIKHKGSLISGVCPWTDTGARKSCDEYKEMKSGKNK